MRVLRSSASAPAAVTLGFVLLSFTGMTAALNGWGESFADRPFMERRLVRLFSLTGTQFAQPDFDMQAYVNHACFGIVGTTERVSCERSFGPFADLKALLESGQLHAILQANGVRVPTARIDAAAEEVREREQEQAETSEEERRRRERARNTDMLWAECRQRYTARREQAHCFQRNIRLVLSNRVAEGLLHLD